MVEDAITSKIDMAHASWVSVLGMRVYSEIADRTESHSGGPLYGSGIWENRAFLTAKRH